MILYSLEFIAKLFQLSFAEMILTLRLRLPRPGVLAKILPLLNKLLPVTKYDPPAIAPCAFSSFGVIPRKYQHRFLSTGLRTSQMDS